MRGGAQKTVNNLVAGLGWPDSACSPLMPAAASLGPHRSPVLSSQSSIPFQGCIEGAGDPGFLHCAGQAGAPASVQKVAGREPPGPGSGDGRGAHAFSSSPELQDAWAWLT